MSYVESFETEMELARLDCNALFLDRLQAAHDAEMKQLSKAEFNRGYESGVAARDVYQWKLDRMRNAAIQNLQAVEPSELCGSHEILSAICKAIFEPPMGWTIGAGEILRDHLVYLLGGENVKLPAELDAEFSKNGENHQTGGYDVLGNERNKVVCELQKLRDRGSVWGRELVVVLGLSVGATNDDLCDRLIYLLGGKSIDSDTEPDAKVIQNEEKYQFDGYDVLGNERHKVVCELRKMRLDTGTAIKKLAIALGIRWNAANTPKSCAMIQSRLIHLLGGDDETSSNDDRTCPIAVQSPSITDELRMWVRNHIWQYANNHMELIAIADRIDEQFERVCSQQEAVLQSTIDEMSEFRERDAAYALTERERLQRRIDVLTAKMELDYAPRKKLDEATHDMEMWRDCTENMRKERDELSQKLSARDAIIDNYHQRMKATESKCEELRKKYTELADHTIDVEARLADYVGQYDPTDAKVIELKRTIVKLRTELGEYAEAVMRDYVCGVITHEEAVERIERLKNARD